MHICIFRPKKYIVSKNYFVWKKHFRRPGNTLNLGCELCYAVTIYSSGYNLSARESKKVRINRSTLYPNKDLSTDCSVKYSLFYDERIKLVASDYYLTRIRGNL